MKSLCSTVVLVFLTILLIGDGWCAEPKWKDLYDEALKCSQGVGCPDPVAKAKVVAKEADRQFGPDSSNTIKALKLLADAQRSRGSWHEAQRVMKKICAIKARKFGSAHPNTLASQIELADISRVMGEYDRAEALYSGVLEEYDEAGMLGDLWIVGAISGLGELAYAQQQYDRADSFFSRALPIYEIHRQYQRELGVQAAETVERMGDLQRLQGQYATAAKHYNRGLEMLGASGPAGRRLEPILLTRLGDTYAQWSKPARAMKCFQRALAAQERQTGGSDVSAAVLIKRIADVHRDRGNDTLAEQDYRRCLAVLEGCSPKGCPLVTATLTCLADVYQRQGMTSQAAPIYKKLAASQSGTVVTDR